jgi:sec-independent protein translocase protein TatA
MGPLSWPEILIILVVLLLLFGAKRLPEMGRSLGKGMREFKDAVTGNEEPQPPQQQPEQLNAAGTPTPAPPTPTAPAPADTTAQPNSERVSS